MKKIKVPIYDCTVYFTMDKDEYRKKLRVSDDQDFLTVCIGSDIYILIGDSFSGASSPPYLQCLTHECNHAAMHILGIAGVQFNFENQEALCYLQDFIFRKTYEHSLKVIK